MRCIVRWSEKSGWRAQVRAPNGRIVAGSAGDGYRRQCDALRMAQRLYNPENVKILVVPKGAKVR